MSSIGVSCDPLCHYDNPVELIHLSAKPPPARLPHADCLTAPPEAELSGHVSGHTSGYIQTMVSETSTWTAIDTPSSGQSTSSEPLRLKVSESDTSTSSSESSSDSTLRNPPESSRKVSGPDLEQLRKHVDVLLAFIGMLLGVATSLLVNAASSLRPEPSAAIIPILQQLLAQLHDPEGEPYPTPELFVPDRLMVLVNSLYALGIVLCLVVIFGGTCVKLQLPGELDTSTHVPWKSKERVLQTTVDTLLGCAALAFLLFLTGLCIDKVRLNMTVGLIVTGTASVMILLLLFALLSSRRSASTHCQAPDI